MKVVLIGFMGSGKNSVGKSLAERLQTEFIDMDSLTLQKSGSETISAIFSAQGEKYFRNLEAKVAEELGQKKIGVIATGGGVVTREDTIENLKKDATLIYLKTSFEEVLARIPDRRTRPLLSDTEEAKKLYEMRLPLYEKAADFIIETNRKSIGKIVEEIMEKIK